MRHADGPPLIALLQRRFGANKKNMLYMGSTAYMIFGIESSGINPTEVHTVQYPHDGIQVRPDQITRVRENQARYRVVLGGIRNPEDTPSLKIVPNMSPDVPQFYPTVR